MRKNQRKGDDRAARETIKYAWRRAEELHDRESRRPSTVRRIDPSGDEAREIARRLEKRK